MILTIHSSIYIKALSALFVGNDSFKDNIITSKSVGIVGSAITILYNTRTHARNQETYACQMKLTDNELVRLFFGY